MSYKLSFVQRKCIFVCVCINTTHPHERPHLFPLSGARRPVRQELAEEAGPVRGGDEAVFVLGKKGRGNGFK